MQNAKSEMRMLHTEVKSIKENKKEKERVVGPLDASPVVNTAGFSSSGMVLDPGTSLSFVHDGHTHVVVGGTTEKKMRFPKKIRGNLTNPLKVHAFP